MKNKTLDDHGLIDISLSSSPSQYTNGGAEFFWNQLSIHKVWLIGCYKTMLFQMKTQIKGKIYSM